MSVTYVLFAGNDYYPGGGTRDYVGTYKTVTDAQNALPDCDWAEIAESEHGVLRLLLWYPSEFNKKTWCRYSDLLEEKH